MDPYLFENKCIFNGLILCNFTNKYFDSFPIELIHLINILFVDVCDAPNLISCGENRYNLICIKDKLYMFNYDGIHNLIQNMKTNDFLPLKNIKGFCCGKNYGIILTTDGLYGIGDNGEGQLGLGYYDKFDITCNEYLDYDHIEPIKIETKEEFVFVTCGAYHTMAITKNRKLYGCGSNEFGQLGLANKNKKPDVSIYDEFLSNNFEFLYNNKSNDELDSRYNTLTYCGIESVISVSCGANHTFVLTKNGLFGFGSNEYGELGISNGRAHTSKPQKLNINNVISVHCGNSFTIVRTKNNIYTFGLNITGNGSTHNYKPKIINIKDVFTINCGENYAIIKTKDKLYKMQRASKHGNHNEPTKMINIKGVTSVGIGRKYAILMTKRNIYQIDNKNEEKIINPFNLPQINL